ncbi:hypothetical protein F8388_004962 [Cannabis sativa]|uniref:U-box domain-containing protein n=1 Tax=Cannabis sativa TaxID=3483 RepID=A0A7J6HP07_CANSA|nr:hypothetical protein F8388_004962 [Cannabis sativa]
MDEIEVPQFFICPISLEIMKDPVTLSTGITYDRESIEKWLFSGKNECCPVSKQPIIPDSDLTPNHTLRRLIQAWCTMNASHGIERIPTPKPPINKTQIIKLINDAKSPQSQIKCLRRLRSIAAESETNKRCLESAGAVDFLASLIGNNYNELENDMSFSDHFARASDEALCILNNLQLSETVLKNLMARNQELVESLTKVMQRGTCESRVHAVVLLKSLLEVADPMRIIGLRPELFVELVQVLKDQDQVSRAAFKAALQLLIQLCPWGRNRIKAVEAGAVPVLIELLLETNSSEKRRCVEVAMAVLDTLCGCAEGRAEFLHHSAGLAMVSKKILRVSQTASEKAVRILHSISKFSATSGVLQEMLQLGVVAKLCLVVQKVPQMPVRPWLLESRYEGDEKSMHL